MKALQRIALVCELCYEARKVRGILGITNGADVEPLPKLPKNEAEMAPKRMDACWRLVRIGAWCCKHLKCLDYPSDCLRVLLRELESEDAGLEKILRFETSF